MEAFMQTQNSQDGWWQFLKLCTHIKTEKELDDLFFLLLTSEEREDIARRHLIIRELLKGEKNQREMAEELNVSIAKITRGSNSLKLMDDKFRSTLRKKII